jgi:hypothetical protein
MLLATLIINVTAVILETVDRFAIGTRSPFRSRIGAQMPAETACPRCGHILAPNGHHVASDL